MSKNSEKESRCFKSEIRAVKNENSTVVRGYAALYNSRSENLGGFREEIKPGAFDKVLQNDVRALINHDSNLVLGRTTSGTLRLGTDERGLWYEYDSPDTTYARDLLVSMERGDVDQSSFQFTVSKDNWTQDTDGTVVRSIEGVGLLLDVSPVTYPAYTSTSVSKRALDEVEKLTAEKQHDNSWQIEAEAREREITILKLK